MVFGEVLNKRRLLILVCVLIVFIYSTAAMDLEIATRSGAGAYIFDDGTALGISLSGTWRFKLKNPAMSIPLTIRADFIFGRALTIPINIMTGFSYRIKN